MSFARKVSRTQEKRTLTKELRDARIHDAGRCPDCGSFAWLDFMKPAHGARTVPDHHGWHHPTCKALDRVP